jgi:hypothetical protein
MDISTYGDIVGHAQVMSMPALFVNSLIETLKEIRSIFPENRALAWFIEELMRQQGNPEREFALINRWHFEMRHHAHNGDRRAASLYTAVTARDYNTFVKSEHWVLQAILGDHVFFHPEISDEDRNNMLECFEDINSMAYVYAIIPEDARKKCSGCLQELKGSTTPVNRETLTSVLQKTWEANTDHVFTWTTQVSKALLEPDAKETVLHALEIPKLKPVLEKIGLGSEQLTSIFRGMFDTIEAAASAGGGEEDGDGEDEDGEGGGGALVAPPSFAAVGSMLNLMMPELGTVADGLFPPGDTTGPIAGGGSAGAMDALE